MNNCNDFKDGNRNQRFQNCKKHTNVFMRRMRRLDKYSVYYMAADESDVVGNAVAIRLGRQR